MVGRLPAGSWVRKIQATKHVDRGTWCLEATNDSRDLLAYGFSAAVAGLLDRWLIESR